MTGSLGFAIGALLTWFGYGAAFRALYLGLKARSGAATGRAATLTLVLAALTLVVGGRLTMVKTLSIPLVWFVMPFAAWAFALSVTLVLIRAQQAITALNPSERRVRIQATALWAVAAIVFAYWYRLDEQAEVRIIQGAIPLSRDVAIGMLLLAIAAVVLMVVTARAARIRGVTKTVVTHLALIVGSILFGIPFAWLVITSFKEDIDMSSPNGIVWVPRVQETVPYFSKTKPRYSTDFNGTRVQGLIISQKPDGKVRLDVNKPMAMRGMTVDTTFDKIKETPVDAPLVRVTMDGVSVKGMVVDELEDGHKKVQALEPASLKGREAVYKPSEVVPVRKVGLRTANYTDALDYLPVEANKGLTYLKNTLLIVILGLAGTILSSAIVAYAFSRMRFPGRDLLFWLMLATMMLPGAVTKLPQFMIFKQLGWIDTLYPLWVPAFFGSAFNIFMLRQFFKQIPMELEDAAKIDGASYLRTFWSVMMPLIKPALAVIAIMTFVGAWNNFLDPLIYISSPENMTISYAVQLYASDRSGEPGLLTAFTTMSMLPVLALFFVAQKYFIEGVTLTGLGGR